MTIRELESLYANLTPANGNEFIKEVSLVLIIEGDKK